MGFGVWGGLQWIGNGCGIQIDEFLAQTDPYSSICKDFYDFVQFGIISSHAWKGLETASNVLSLANPEQTDYECPRHAWSHASRVHSQALARAGPWAEALEPGP